MQHYDQGTVCFELETDDYELPEPLDAGVHGYAPVIIPSEQVLSEWGCEELVRCPRYVDRNQWIAMKSFELWNEIRMLFSALSSRGLKGSYTAMCREGTCPALTNGCRVCRWPEDGSAPTPLSAPEHMYMLVNHVHSVLTNRALVPQDGSRFPDAFLPEMTRVHRLLFQVFAHAILHHENDFLGGSGTGKSALRASFAHWFFFVREFKLLSDDDMAPLSAHIEGMMQRVATARSG